MSVFQKRFTMSSVSAVICAAPLIASLIPCPDCEKMVSRRAWMCPNCGCKGDVIAEVAKTIPEQTCGDILDIDSDGTKSYALPVEFDGRLFAVLPLDPVLGTSKLSLSHKGKQIEWSVPELAVDAPIVRLQIADTNLTYWTTGGTLRFNGTRIKVSGNEVSAIISPCVATNAFLIAGRRWEVLQPKQMKVHGRHVRNMLKGEPYDLPQRTHAYFKMIESQKKENSK